MNSESHPRNWHNVPTGQLLGLVIDWAAKINEAVAGWDGVVSNVRKLFNAVWPLAPDGERIDRFGRIEASIEKLAVCHAFAQRLQAVEENHAKLWAEVMQPDSDGSLSKQLKIFKEVYLENMPKWLACAVLLEKLDASVLEELKRLGRFGGRLEALEERIKHLKIITEGSEMRVDGKWAPVDVGAGVTFPHCESKPSDPINPNHYKHPTLPGVECIQFSEHMGYHLGQAFAYAWRVYLGGQALSLCAQDLKKARWYVERYLTLDPEMTYEHPFWRNRGAISDYGVIMTALYDATATGQSISRKSILGSLLIDLDRAIDVFEEAVKTGNDPRKKDSQK